MAAKDCIDAVQKAANGKLTDDEVLAVFEAVDRKKKRLEAEGKVDGLGARLTEAMREEGDKARVLAAMQRKHAALNAIARDRIETHIANLQASGMRPDKALLALMEGSQVGIDSARKSVHATKLAYEAKFVGGMIAELEKTRPHLVAMLHDEKFNSDITREMFELREGGSPGKTGNEDAKAVAKIFATYAEVSRTELNRLGAAIGKLDGWAGPQAHDDIKMLKAGEDAWVGKIVAHLDVERSFPDVTDAKELDTVLRNIYTDIVTGRDRNISAQQKGEFTSPANLAKKLGEHRVLHFKSADDWLAYREAFGYGNAFSAMVSHQRRAATLAGQMDIFGPNPAVMLGSVVESMALKVRNDASLDAKAKQKIISRLEVDPGKPGNAIEDAYLEMAGLTSSTPLANRGWAKAGAEIRAGITAAKLTGAVLTSLPTDNVMAGLAGMFRGSGFFRTFVGQIDGLLHGRPKGEQAQIAAILNEGYDGLIDHILHPFAAQDAGRGIAARSATWMFKWTGMTWGTDVARSVAGRMIAAELGGLSGKSHGSLSARYRNTLMRHGIGAQEWEAMRFMARKAANGKTYLMPDMARSIPDTALQPFVDARMAGLKPPSTPPVAPGMTRLFRGIGNNLGPAGQTAFFSTDYKKAKHYGNVHFVDVDMKKDGKYFAQGHGGTDEYVTDARKFIDGVVPYKEGSAADAARIDAMMTRFREDARRDIEMGLRRFVADETNYGIIETDARSRRLTLRGTQSGTWAGEGLRFIMQFKGFPIAFTERVMGRAAFGGVGETAGQRFMSNIPHIGAMMAGLTAAGYLSMTLKDLARGYWPPREPNAKALTAAFLQGGASGIFGDFLFADVNRFGNSALETMAGPGFSDLAKLNNAFRKSVRGETKGLEAFNMLHDNVPMLNLWYTRAATEVLYANAMREWLSPGYLRRRDANRYKNFKQERWVPDNMQDALN